jgi:hypothetical protein
MGLFDKLFGKKPEPVKVEEPKKERKPRKPKEKKQDVPTLSEKDKATQAGEPYVSILKMELDPDDVNNGAFELDWNDKFVLNLIKAGYKQRDDDTDQLIVERWFQYVCRNVALELYEQQQADPDNRDLRVVRTKDLGNGRTEVS